MINKDKLPACRRCPYFERPFVPSEGSLDAEVVFVADSPWRSEEKSHRPLVGPAGQIYNAILEEYGLERRDVFTTNTVHCVPERLGQAHPLGVMELCTKLYLKRELEQIQPKLVVPLGNVALKGMGVSENISRARGLVKEIEFKGRTYKILPSFHPSLILRKPAYLPYAEQDFQAIQYFLEHGKQQPQNNDLDYRSVTTKRELEAFFLEFEKARHVAWDTETTGLDYRADEIIAMQFSFAPRKGYCLPLYVLPYEENAYTRQVSVFSKHVMTRLFHLLHNQNKIFFFWNGKFDLRMMYRFFLLYFQLTINVDQIRWHDGMSMYGLLNENTFQTLKEVSKIHTDLRYSSKELAQVKGGQMKKVPLDEMTAYGCLSYESRVVLADGSLEKISKLVQQRYTGKVQCFDGEGIVAGRVVGWYRSPAFGQEWYRIITPSTFQGRCGYLGAQYTPDHEIYTARGRVRVDAIRIGRDKILTGEKRFSSDQLSVFLGSMVGDGGLHSKNGVLSGFRFGQTFPRLGYAAWKAEVFSNFSPVLQVKGYSKVGNAFHQYTLPYSRYLAYLHRILPIKSAEEHAHRKLRFTEDVLERLGVLGLAVWYQDDGSLADCDTRISSTRVTEEEISLVINWLLSEFGIKCSYYRSIEQGGIFAFYGDDERRFHKLILPFIHPDCAYKSIYAKLFSNHRFAAPVVCKDGLPFYEIITGVERCILRPRTENVRWCIAVQDYGNFLTQDGIVANCKDSDATRRMSLKFAKELHQQDLWDIYCKHDASDMKIAKILYKMELFGAPIDLKEMAKLEHFMQTKLMHYHKRMEALVGKQFNPNSDPQLRKVLFEDLKFPIPEKRTPGGQISTDKEVISGLIEQFPNNKFLKNFRMHRNYTSIEETFVRGFEKKLDTDGRLHPDFGFARTVSGRIVCYRPNLANIPREKEFEEGVFIAIRSLFAAKPGKKIVYGDFSQQEFKCMALLSGDHALIKALFEDREDFHTLVARALYPKYAETEILLRRNQKQLLDIAITSRLREKIETKIQSYGILLKNGRTKAKNFNFGRNYLATIPTLATALGISEQEVERYIIRLAEKYPDFEEYMHANPEDAVREGEMRNRYGRYRRFPSTPDERVRQEQVRQAGNFPAQSNSAYMGRAALVRIATAFERVGMNSYPFNVVYDSILIESPDDEVKDASEIMVSTMIAPVPELDNRSFGIEWGVGQNWQEAEKNAKKIYTMEDFKPLELVR